MDFTLIRERMVYDQLYNRGITDQGILDVFSNIPRHLFVPEDKQGVSYEDYPVSIGYGQTISQPYIAALTAKALAAEPGMKLLEVGCGSGYTAAIMASLGIGVFSVEIIPELAEGARKIIASLGLDVTVINGDGGIGLVAQAPFDRIIVSAAVELVPQELFDQLAIGGILVAPVGGFLHQYLTMFTKESSYEIKKQEICQCVFVPLAGKYKVKEQR
jgi:protein-L-isoaspartate(D-aspartate) O-methyltransferase